MSNPIVPEKSGDGNVSAPASGSLHLDAQTLLELKPILDAGNVAISHRGHFQALTVKIATALGVPCDNFKSEIIHAQYMELGNRILARIAEDCSAAGVEEEMAALRTYRRIWERLPERLRHDMLASMRCWSPLDYEVMVAEEKRHNDPDQRPGESPKTL